MRFANLSFFRTDRLLSMSLVGLTLGFEIILKTTTKTITLSKNPFRSVHEIPGISINAATSSYSLGLSIPFSYKRSTFEDHLLKWNELLFQSSEHLIVGLFQKLDAPLVLQVLRLSCRRAPRAIVVVDGLATFTKLLWSQENLPLFHHLVTVCFLKHFKHLRFYLVSHKIWLLNATRKSGPCFFLTKV